MRVCRIRKLLYRSRNIEYPLDAHRRGCLVICCLSRGEAHDNIYDICIKLGGSSCTRYNVLRTNVPRSCETKNPPEKKRKKNNTGMYSHACISLPTSLISLPVPDWNRSFSIILVQAISSGIFVIITHQNRSSAVLLGSRRERKKREGDRLSQHEPRF